jgi:hypothetical protein
MRNPALTAYTTERFPELVFKSFWLNPFEYIIICIMAHHFWYVYDARRRHRRWPIIGFHLENYSELRCANSYYYFK